MTTLVLLYLSEEGEDKRSTIRIKKAHNDVLKVNNNLLTATAIESITMSSVKYGYNNIRLLKFTINSFHWKP